jgi:hypothetical protein
MYCLNSIDDIHALERAEHTSATLSIKKISKYPHDPGNYTNMHKKEQKYPKY